MHKKSLLSLLLAGVIIITSISPATVSEAKITPLKINKKSVSVDEGKTVSVGYKSKKKIKVKSTKKSVCTASVKGKKIKIKGKNAGQAKVNVTMKYKKSTYKKSIKVTVNKKNKVKPTNEPSIVNQAAQNLAPYSKSINNFGNIIFEKGNVSPDSSNRIISPLSLHLAFSMLANGASGETYNQLVKTLGTSDLNEYNNYMMNYINGSLDEKVTVNIANSVLFNGKADVINPNIDKDFINPVKDYYGAEINRNAAFNIDTVKEVNNWVNEKTNKMIPSIIDKFDPDTIMCLLNAIYFEANWMSKFNKYDTKDEIFHGKDGDKIVEMMEHGGRMKLISDSYFEAGSLEYGNGKYSMDIYMSNVSGKTAFEVFNSLTDEQKNNTLSIFDSVKDTKKMKTVKLPKFSIDYSCENAIDILQSVGLTDVFDRQKSDLSKIARDSYVNLVKHKAKIDVFEDGTKAAAVTMIGIACTTAINTQKEEEYEFIVNRPFIFTIRDKVSGIVLFIGAVNDLHK